MKSAAMLFLATLVMQAQSALTPRPRGQIHVEGNQLVDEAGRPFVLRGVEMPGMESPALNATTFSTIRIRWNMNALRLAVSIPMSLSDQDYLPRAAGIVRKANQAGLVVILAAAGGSQDGIFWRNWAAYFRDYSQVIFDLYGANQGDATALIDAIRSAGATQPVAVRAPSSFDTLLHDPNVVYEVQPHWSGGLTDGDRDLRFGWLPSRVPVLAAHWGFTPGEDSPDCRALPNDSAGAEDVLLGALRYFDAHAISWTAASFAPGSLLVDYEAYFNSEMAPTWACDGIPAGGIGEVVRYWLWGVDDDEFISVNGASGSPAIAPGSLVVAYAQSISDSAEFSDTNPLPTTLGGIQVEVTDSAGAVRLAPRNP